MSVPPSDPSGWPGKPGHHFHWRGGWWNPEVYASSPHAPSTANAFHHYHFRKGMRGGGPSRLVWLGIGSLLTYWYLKKGRCQKEITSVEDVDGNVIRTTRKWEWQNVASPPQIPPAPQPQPPVVSATVESPSDSQKAINMTLAALDKAQKAMNEKMDAARARLQSETNAGATPPPSNANPPKNSRWW